MGVEVYVWAGGALRRVDAEITDGEGIEVSGVPEGRLRALRDRIYALAKLKSFPTTLKVVVAPAMEAGSTEGVEVAALIAAGLCESDPADDEGAESRVRKNLEKIN